MTKTASPLFLIVVPTHHHPETLEYSLRSALQQTLTDVVVAVIGDGVNEVTRRVVAPLAKADRRLRFYDFPKSVSRGEEYRNQVIRELAPRFITYLCDDDLLLPHHCEHMLEELQVADFVHPQPVYVSPDDQVRSFFRTDLRVDSSVNWLLEPPWRNSISLTGVAHTLHAYLSLTEGWTPTPAGRWTDHYMWQKFLSAPGLRLRTSPLSTTIKFPAPLYSEPDQGDMIRSYFPRLSDSHFQKEWDTRVAEVVSAENVQAFIDRERLLAELTTAEKTLERLHDEVDAFLRTQQSPRRAWRLFRRAVGTWFAARWDKARSRSNRS